MVETAPLCACCKERVADAKFPGLSTQTRDLAGRPIATACAIGALSSGGGARLLAVRIRARDGGTDEEQLSPEASAALKAGLESAHLGEIKQWGDFTKYLNAEDDAQPAP